MEDLEEMDQPELLGEENKNLLHKDEGLQTIYTTSVKPRMLLPVPDRKQYNDRENSLDIENEGNNCRIFFLLCS